MLDCTLFNLVVALKVFYAIILVYSDCFYNFICWGWRAFVQPLALLLREIFYALLLLILPSLQIKIFPGFLAKLLCLFLLSLVIKNI